MHIPLTPVVCLVASVVWAGAAQASSIRFLHTPVASSQASADLTIKGNIFGAGEMERAFVLYRVDGGAWKSVDLELEGTDEYEGVLPGAALTGAAVEYYVQAIDWFGDAVDVFATRARPHKVTILGGTAPVASTDTTPQPVKPTPATDDVTTPRKPPPAQVVSEPVQRPAHVKVWGPDGVIGEKKPEVEEFPVESVSIASRHEQAVSEAPSIVTVMDREQLQALHVRRLVDVVKFVPGFETSRDVQGFWRVAARGRRSDPEILVLLDGHRLNNPYDGRVDWELSLDDIERVEIMRGPGSALYGAGAFGAVINLVPRKDTDVSAVLTGGSYGTVEGSARGGVKLGDVTVHASAGASRRDGYQAVVRRDALSTDPDRTAGVTDDHRLGFDASVRAEYQAADPNQPVLSASVRAWRHERGALVGFLDVVGPGSELSWMTLQGDLAARLVRGNLRFDARLYADNHLTDRLFVLYPPGWSSGSQSYAGGVKEQTSASMWSVGGEVVGQLETGKTNRLGFGLQVERQALSSFDYRANVRGESPSAELVAPEGVVFPQNDPLYSSRIVAGAFIQDAWTPVPSLELTGGVRADFVSGFGVAINPRLALVWNVARPVVLKLLAARAFRAPTFEEYLSVVAISPSLNWGQVQGFSVDDPLSSMSVTTVESGVELSETFLGGRGTLRANGFFNLFQDPIEPVDEGSSPRLVNRDVGVRVIGAEGEARYDWAAKGGSTFVNVSWFRARDLETHQQAPSFSLLTDVPQLRSNFGMVIPLGKLASLGLNAQFGGERRNNARTTLEATRRFRIPAYGLFGASLSTRPLFGVVEVQASVFNLTDLAYLDDVPRPDNARMPGLLPREGLHGMLTLRAAL